MLLGETLLYFDGDICHHKEFNTVSLQRREEQRERDNRYTAVMRSLVWRYVSAMHRRFEESPVTEDDINEVKGEISAMRYELLEIFEKNGMDVTSADRKEKSQFLLI
jgi:transient-receptor-potential-like protein